jgi:hypothetical protein
MGGNNYHWTYDMTEPATRPIWHEGYLDSHAEGAVCITDEKTHAGICRNVVTGESIWEWPPTTDSLSFQWIHPGQEYAVRGVYLADPEDGFLLSIYEIATGEAIYNYKSDRGWNSWDTTAFLPPATWIHEYRHDVFEDRLWIVDLSTGNGEALTLPVAEPHIFALSPDGSLGIAQSASLTSEEFTQTTIWDVTSGEILTTVETQDGTFINTPVFSPDMTQVAWGSNYGITLIDIPTGQIISYLEVMTGMIPDMAFGSTNNHFISYHPFSSTPTTWLTSQIIGWDITAGERVDELTRNIDPGHGGNIDDLALNTSGTMLASGSTQALMEAEVFLWDLQTGKFIERLQRNSAAVDFRLDGNLLLDGSVYPINPSVENEHRQTLYGGIENFVSGDGRYVTWKHDPYDIDANTVTVVAIDTGEIVAEMPIPLSHQVDLALNEDGSRLFAMSRDSVQVWDVTTETLLADACMAEHPVELLDITPAPLSIGENYVLVEWTQQGVDSTFIGLLSPEYAMYPRMVRPNQTVGETVFNPDANLMVVSGSEGIEFWDIMDEKLLCSIPDHTYPAFSADGRLMATNNDSVIWLWGIPDEE